MFVLVEGRDHDRPFYERLLSKYPPAASSGFTIRLVEDLKLDGVSAGGKPFAHKLFDYFDANGYLNQRNSVGPRQIVFMLDKDFEDFEPQPRSSPHLIATESADVEAEILRTGKLRKSLAATYGLTKAMVRDVAPNNTDPFTDLGLRWERWLQARATSCSCGLPGAAKYGNLSQINRDIFGPLDSALESVLFTHIGAAVLAASAQADALTAQTEVTTRLASDRAHELIKGRWLSKYFAYLVKTQLSGLTIKNGVAPDALVGVALATVDFKGSWTTHYRQRLDALLAMT
ncbi:hypothetical protein [Agreia sp. Leaf283]|uniref:hypothetical protein n=1 Tax=Agreia sp. Leaf283 TaxID=1736321 RepID=UPI0006F749EF|nr:hypothetical protein [Agreia sp. Leaf283]KQP53967.1 hypothetical protein ASF51_17730 [Agreia sp. Leaf283]